MLFQQGSCALQHQRPVLGSFFFLNQVTTDATYQFVFKPTAGLAELGVYAEFGLLLDSTELDVDDPHVEGGAVLTSQPDKVYCYGGTPLALASASINLREPRYPRDEGVAASQQEPFSFVEPATHLAYLLTLIPECRALCVPVRGMRSCYEAGVLVLASLLCHGCAKGRAYVKTRFTVTLAAT